MNNDKNSNDKLNKLLSEMDTPAVDKNAKKRAINLAMAEFKQHQQEKIENTKGFQTNARPINNFLNAYRTKLMIILNNKLLYSGIATVSVAVIGTLLFQQTYTPPVDTTQITLTEGITSNIKETPLEKREVAQKQPHNQSITVSEAEQAREPTNQIAQSIPSSTGVTRSQEKKVVVGTLSNNFSSEDAGRPASSPATVLTDSSLQQQSFEEIVVNNTQPSKAKRKSDADKYAISTASKAAPDILPHQSYQDEGRDKFESVETNPIKRVSEDPVSTFSIDVDTAAYSFVRRQLNQGVLPQKDAVRIEEMVNYFDYTYPLPESKAQPFKPSVVIHPSPWNKGKQLIHIGIKGYEIAPEKQPRSNLVLLLDVSGSMNSPDKLPLVKQSMSMLLNSLHPDDTIGIVVYAGAAGQILEPTAAKEKQKILNALNRLNAGGSTAGGQGIKLAYQLAEANFDKNAVNRIILATDGDFNVGITNQEELKGFVERKRSEGIFLSVLGFGQGNYNDHMMQTLAQNGNGVAAYIDSISEAQKVLIDEATSTLFPIAKDVKIQVEFNPDTISEYRLVGYETRHLNREDFNNDAVDAGDIGAGHTVTAIYEITPKHSEAKPSVDPLRYGKEKLESKQSPLDQEYGFLKIRYKLPNEDKSRLITQAIDNEKAVQKNTLNPEVKFATAVAGFSQLLKDGKYTGDYTYDDVIDAAQASKGNDEFGYRTEFIQLVRKAKTADLIK